MNRSLRLGATMAVLLLGLLAPPGTIAADPRTAPSSEELGHAIRFRASFGFDHSTEAVRASYEAARYSSVDWGVPLSPEELEDLAARSRYREAIGPALTAAAATEGDGGAFLDQLRGGLVVFQSVDPDRLAGALAGVRDIPREYAVARVTHTLQQLLGIKDEIIGQAKVAARDENRILSVGIDVKGNRVLVRVNGAIDAIGDELRDRYGDAVAVESSHQGDLDACNEMADCWPMKGGLGCT